VSSAIRVYLAQTVAVTAHRRNGAIYKDTTWTLDSRGKVKGPTGKVTIEALRPSRADIR
jgi:hypothetical protein